MSFHKVFKHPKVVLPVIHVEDDRQALRNVEVARNHGADGVWLISHGALNSDRLLAVYQFVRKEHPDWWLGVNFLDLDTHGAVSEVLKNPDINGLWVDNAWTQDPHYAGNIWKRLSSWEGLYFGGTAFKYQGKVKDYGEAAQVAEPYMDVVTTSGPGTGVAASTDKLKEMKDALKEKPLAVASGVEPSNVQDMIQYADALLVATGVSKSFTELDPLLLSTLINMVREVS